MCCNALPTCSIFFHTVASSLVMDYDVSKSQTVSEWKRRPGFRIKQGAAIDRHIRAEASGFRGDQGAYSHICGAFVALSKHHADAHG